MRRILGWMVAGTLALGPVPAKAQQEDSTVKKDVKQAGKTTGRAAKSTGKALKKGTERVVHVGAKATRKGAQKVEKKTEKK